MIPHEQPLRPTPALLAGEPTAQLVEQHVPAVPRRHRLLVQDDTTLAGPTEGRQGERPVSEGAEDEGTVEHDSVYRLSLDRLQWIPRLVE